MPALRSGQANLPFAGLPRDIGSLIRAKQSLPCESFAGCRLQVSFKIGSDLFIWKATMPSDSPREKRLSGDVSSRIMNDETLFEIRSATVIKSLRM